MNIKEITQLNQSLKLYKTYANFTYNGTKYRRLVLQKNSVPHIVSEDCEALIDGEWVPSPSP